jgi:hypothetical protein
MKTKKTDKQDGKGNKMVPPTKRSILKIISLTVVVIFIVIIVIGLLKEHYEKPSVKLTENDLLAAKDVVSTALQARGDDISNYEFTASSQIRIIGIGKDFARLVQACLSNNQTRHVYLIDLNSKNIMMHSEAYTYTDNVEIQKYAPYRNEDPCLAR